MVASRVVCDGDKRGWGVEEVEVTQMSRDACCNKGGCVPPTHRVGPKTDCVGVVLLLPTCACLCVCFAQLRRRCREEQVEVCLAGLAATSWSCCQLSR